MGTAATRAALPHGTARFHFGTHMSPHPATRHRTKRFHHIEISLRNNLEGRRAARRDVMRSALAALSGAVSAARSRREADAFPVLAHRVPVKIYIPVRSAGGGRHGPPLRKIGIVERGVNVPFLCRPGRKLRRTHYSRQRAWKSTESIEVRPLVPKGFISSTNWNLLVWQ